MDVTAKSTRWTTRSRPQEVSSDVRVADGDGRKECGANALLHCSSRFMSWKSVNGWELVLSYCEGD